MNKMTKGMLCLLPVLLAGCSQVARSAADNRPANVLGIGGVTLQGTVGAQAQAVQAQSGSATVSYHNSSVADFDLSSLPGIVGSPSGVNVDLAFQSAQFSNCSALPSSFSVTVSGVHVSASDAAHSASADVTLNASLSLAKNADGSYAVSFNGAQGGIFGTLLASWSTFGPIFTKSGADTPNSVTVSANVTSDAFTTGCTVSLTTPANLVQRVRFQ